jgi:PERQ amino acid-rich with GYF domain-containing protein
LDIATGDRSQTSSTGPGRTFSNFGGLGGVSSLGGTSGWSPSGGLGTPTRERSGFSGFGESIFGTMADIQSPSLVTLPGGGFLGSQGVPNTGSIGRVSKMGSLFPPMMQEQMQGDQVRQDSIGIEGVNRQSGRSPQKMCFRTNCFFRLGIPWLPPFLNALFMLSLSFLIGLPADNA